MTQKISGKKFSGKHTTFIDAAEGIIRNVKDNPRIAKISLGIIRKCRPGRGVQNIKIKDTDSGLEVIIRGNAYVQTIYIYLNNPEVNRHEVAGIIDETFRN